MTMTDDQTAEALEMFSAVFPHMEATPQLMAQYDSVLRRAVSATLAFDAIDMYSQEHDSPYPTPAGLKERVVRVNARYTTEHARDPLSLDATTSAATRRQVHDAKQRLMQAKASPASDPEWADDTPPWRECQSLADWFEQQPEDQRKRIANVSPQLAAKFGVVILEEPDNEKDAAIARAQAFKRGGWS